jgi:hypothetical protein
MELLRLVPGFQRQMVETGRAPLLLLLAAFLVTFALTRLYTRVARRRGWGSGSVGGVHLHHMAVGIVLVLVVGMVELAARPGSQGRDALAVLFGMGAALTLDEFALWLYLRDVYWSPEGRSSIDASVVGVLLAALLLVGSAPFGIHDGHGESRSIVFAMVSVNVLLALVTFAKGKVVLGVVGVFVPLVALAGAVRLATPRSLWARHLYAEHARERARERFEGDSWRNRLHVRLDDLIGGAPSQPERPAMEIVGGRLVLRDPQP